MRYATFVSVKRCDYCIMHFTLTSLRSMSFVMLTQCPLHYNGLGYIYIHDVIHLTSIPIPIISNFIIPISIQVDTVDTPCCLRVVVVVAVAIAIAIAIAVA